MADGGRRERLMEKSLPRCLSFSVKQKRKQMHMEEGEEVATSSFLTGSSVVYEKHEGHLKKLGLKTILMCFVMFMF